MERQTKIMEDLYCDICKKYTPHEDKICTVCGEEYDESKKRYIICGAADHPEVIKSTLKILESDPGAIIINEDVALAHKLGTSAIESKKYIQQEDLFMSDMKNLYDGVPKKLRGKKVEPVRDSKETPKFQRNEPCPCGKLNSIGKRVKSS